MARQQGLTEELVAELPHYAQSELFTSAEKTAIQYADILAGDHRQASQELFDELRQHFTEPEIVDLGWRISMFVGYGRFIHALGLELGKTCPLSIEESETQAAAD